MSANQSAVIAAVSKLGVSGGPFSRVLDTPRSPTAVELLGTSLAEALRPHRPGLVMTWDSSDDAVLAHVVARHLGVGATRACYERGLLFLDPDVAELGDVALIGAAWDRQQWLSPLPELVSGRRGRVTVIGAVLGTSVLETIADVPTVALLPNRTVAAP